jgi:flavin reductase (DIM6/NTAB) family NADH-FMN oxidoreductase RutF/rubredoxin
MAGQPILDKKSLGHISYGLYIISAQNSQHHGGQIANAVFQVAADPVKIAVTIHRDNFTYSLIQASGEFGVSVLAKEAPLSLFSHWGYQSGRHVDKFKEATYIETETGLRLVYDSATAVLAARVTETLDVGTHTLFVGEVFYSQHVGQGPVLTYDEYQNVKKGQVPQTAPTYRGQVGDAAEASPLKPGTRGRYLCSVCGYLYDPEHGSPEGHLPPHTPFAEIGEDWCCPFCRAGKEKFDPYD